MFDIYSPVVLIYYYKGIVLLFFYHVIKVKSCYWLILIFVTDMIFLFWQNMQNS